MKPIATLAFRGYDEVVKDIEFLGQLGGNPQLAQQIEEQLKALTGGQGLAGIDKSRPWGVGVATDGQAFVVRAFVPVTDLDAFLKVIEPHVGPAERQGEMRTFSAGEQTVYVRQQGNWAFISNRVDAVKTPPADPLVSLGGMEKRYDLAVRMIVKNIPPMFRNMMTGALQMAQMGMQADPNETPEQFRIRMQAMQQTIAGLNTALNEMDALEIGLDVNRQARNAAVEWTMTALEGTAMAKLMSASTGLKTRYAGFFDPGAALTFGAVAKLSPENIQEIQTQLAARRQAASEDLDQQEDLTDAHRQLAKQVVNQLFDVIDATVKAGQLDMAGSVRLAGDSPVVLVASTAADTKKLEDALKQAADQAGKELAPLKVQWAAGEHRGVRLHKVTIPTADMGGDTEQLRKVFGDSLEVTVGIGPQAAYLAAGKGSADALKQAIDQSGTAAAAVAQPLRLSASLGQFADFMARVAEGEDQQRAAAIAQAFKKMPGKDHVLVRTANIPKGQKTRIELQEGVLGALGALP
jgi:hypothetical protein